MESIRQFLKNDKFAEHMGIELLEASRGRARAKMQIKEHHLNGLKIVQGGAIFTLADLALAAAANSYDGIIAVGINASISYLKATRAGTLIAEAREISRSHKFATYTVNITNLDGEVVAIFQGMVYRKKKGVDFM